MSEMPKITQAKYKILSNKKVGPENFKMTICAPQLVRFARPGQFVHLRCANSRQPLLRRPFSLHRLKGNNFEILYKIIGPGTNLLAKKQKGAIVDVLGPLGNGFELKRTTKGEGRRAILVAGGMGVAPLFALAEKLADLEDILVLIGARTKKAILCARDFKKLASNVEIATDDGSQGHKGFVSELLQRVLRGTTGVERRTIYACGPKPMLQEIAAISRRFHISAYGSLEENMACGVGACLGCVIKTKVGYQRVCKDGPVFDLKQIMW